jgi:hypothetical protein
VIASKQNYIIGAKDSKYRKGPYYPTAPHCFNFFLEIYFEAPHEKTYLLSPSFAALVRVSDDYFIGSKDFIILEVAMFSLCHSMFTFFSWKFILKPQMKKLLLRPE